MNLFIDTAVKGCNIALFDQNKSLAIAQEPIERGFAERLIPLYEELMQGINKTPKDIENIYVTVGPGSFTGLRVGLTVARFIGFSCSVPVQAITTFQAFSAGVDSNKDRCVVVETKRSDFYYQMMNSKHEFIGEPQSIVSAEIERDLPNYNNCIITGDAVNRLSAEIEISSYELIQQDMINVKAVVALFQQSKLELQNPDAFYIRDVDVSKPKKLKA